MKKHLSTVILCAALLLGLGLLLYPTVSNYWNSFRQSQAISNYAESVSRLSKEDYDRLWAEAETYNRSVARRNGSLNLPESERQAYESLLNISETGVMGYISISQIGVNLPIYHGTSDEVLQVAVGHLDGTSLPVGGESTHCVLSGHRGLPSAKLFTDLDKLSEGDLFTLQILNQTLTYEIDQIRIVDPQDTADLVIVEGEDYCTLVTCTPYAINSHRMLLRGVRTENQSSSTIRVTTEGLRVDPVLVIPFAAAPMLLVLLLGVFFLPGKKKRK